MTDFLGALAKANLQRTGMLASAYQESVIPIYKAVGQDPEIIGSGVLLRVRNRHFLVTAAHVRVQHEPTRPLCIISSQPHYLEGCWVGTQVRPPFRRDKFDWAYIELELAVVNDLGSKNFITEYHPTIIQGEALGVGIGFPISKNRVNSQRFRSQENRYRIQSNIYSYQEVARAEGNHIHLRFPRRTVRSLGHGRLEKFPALHGMSGGAVMVTDHFVKPSRLILAGIIIEFYEDKITAIQIAHIIHNITSS